MVHFVPRPLGSHLSYLYPCSCVLEFLLTGEATPDEEVEFITTNDVRCGLRKALKLHNALARMTNGREIMEKLVYDIQTMASDEIFASRRPSLQTLVVKYTKYLNE